MANKGYLPISVILSNRACQRRMGFYAIYTQNEVISITPLHVRVHYCILCIYIYIYNASIYVSLDTNVLRLFDSREDSREVLIEKKKREEFSTQFGFLLIETKSKNPFRIPNLIRSRIETIQVLTRIPGSGL